MSLGVYSRNGRFYTQGLARQLRQDRIYDPDYALANEPEIYEKMRRYPVIAGALELRKLLATGDRWSCKPASKAPQDAAAVPIFTELLRQCSGFNEARFNLFEGVMKGSSWAKIYGEPRWLAIGGRWLRWWVPTALQDVDKRRMVLLRDKSQPETAGEEKRYAWHLEDPRQPEAPQPIDRDHYVRFCWSTQEDTLGYGRGLSEPLIYPFWWASGLDEHGAQFAERWAQGFRVWKLADVNAAGAATKRADYLSIVDEFVSRYAAVVGKDDEFELHDAPAAAFTSVKELLAYYHGVTRVLILGNSLLTDPKVEGGSFALGKTMGAQTRLIIQRDRAVGDEAIRSDLLWLLLRLNWANFRALGFAITEPPYFVTGDEEASEPETRRQQFESATTAGLALKREEAYAALDFTAPAPGEDVFVKAPAPAPMLPGGFGAPAVPSFARGASRAFRRELADAVAGSKGSPVFVNVEPARAPKTTVKVPRARAPKVNVHNAVSVPQGPAPVVNVNASAPTVNVAAANAPAPTILVSPTPIQVTNLVQPAEVVLRPAAKTVKLTETSGRLTGAEITPHGSN